jgi:predicted DNA-binding antitoxin AbrB/MazE fold protein
MVQATTATFENGVLVPDQPLNLSPHARVRLTVNPLDNDADRQKAWDDLQQLWQTSTFDSKGDRLTREQLHERR